MLVMCGNISCGYNEKGLCSRGIIEIESGSGICKYLKNRHWYNPVSDDCKYKDNVLVLEKRKEPDANKEDCVDKDKDRDKDKDKDKNKDKNKDKDKYKEKNITKEEATTPNEHK